MTNHEIAERVREAIRRRRLRPARERFEDMVRRGVIDQKGKILLGMRLPPGTELDDDDRLPEAGSTTPPPRP